jgi:hypothetical protein
MEFVFEMDQIVQKHGCEEMLTACSYVLLCVPLLHRWMVCIYLQYIAVVCQFEDLWMCRMMHMHHIVWENRTRGIKTFQLMQIEFVGVTINEAQVFEHSWHFKEGQMSNESDKHRWTLYSQQKQWINSDICDFIENIGRLATPEFAEKVRILYGSS